MEIMNWRIETEISVSARPYLGSEGIMPELRFSEGKLGAVLPNPKNPKEIVILWIEGYKEMSPSQIEETARTLIETQSAAVWSQQKPPKNHKKGAR